MSCFSPLFPDSVGDVSQLQSMIDYQERILRDLADSNNRYREVLKANEALEKQLENATKDLESERAKLAYCENRLIIFNVLVIFVFLS